MPAVTARIALLRGINVGGNRSIRMTALAEVFTAAGCTGVRTYIQSGNVVFDHPEGNRQVLEAALETRIEAATGFAVPVLVRTAADLQEVVEGNPFADREPTTVHVAFLAGETGAAAPTVLGRAASERESWLIEPGRVYLCLPDGSARSKLLVAVDRIGTRATVRNWKTVTTLAAMLAGA
jgi:uncharacterized protein (DUF1697 family)